MFGFVKTFFSRPAEIPSAAPLAPSPRFHARSSAVPSATPTATSGTRTDVLELPLSSLRNNLPAEVQAGVRLPAGGDAHIAVPLSVIVPQFGRGSVKVTFGQLRSMANEGVFVSHSNLDHFVIELPLGEILSRLNPDQMPRRSQRRVEVPEEITSPFNGAADSLNFYKPDPASAHSFIPTAHSSPGDEPPVVSGFPTRGAFASAPPAMPFPNPPSNGNRNDLVVPLADICEAWPTAVRQEIEHTNLSRALVNIPLASAEEGLRRGRAIFTWKQIRCWMNPPVTTASPFDNELVELPLKAIAPIFFAKQPNGSAALPNGGKVHVDEQIPDLFSAAPTGTPDTSIFKTSNPRLKPVTFVAPPEPPTVNTGTNLAEALGKARQSETSYFRAGTDFLRRSATPNDIVNRATGLTGVAGALITLSDGLLIAKNLPVNVQPDALAAFVPQVIGRIGQSAREFRLGDLGSLNFTVGNVPWEIRRIGTIVFAAFGRAGEALPTAQLSALAAELDRKK
jgi:predicted regulator of Ras-like GTPase activity (Roadblock/LC7/MglB family)